MKQKQTHGHKEQTVVAKGEGEGEGGGGGKDWEFGISRCKLLYIGWINKVHCIAQGTIFNIL